MRARSASSPERDGPRAARAGAVLVAAGTSTRMGGLDKIWAPVAGAPLIAWTVAAFERTPEIAASVLVVAAERIAAAEALAAAYGWRRTRIVAGGARRRDSVRCGLEALPARCRWVVVHDGARPLVTAAAITAGLALARERGTAIASEPVKETIKRVEASLVVETPARAHLRLLQTPQIFPRARLLRAHAAADPTADPPDDATLAYALGWPLAIYSSGADNLKVTTPDDLPVVEALLRERGTPARMGEPLPDDATAR
jgi:2-C-methyl-D-erythritol 4-phosphate cytidylyltransferase